MKTYLLKLTDEEHRLIKTRAAMASQSIKEFIISLVYKSVEGEDNV